MKLGVSGGGKKKKKEGEGELLTLIMQWHGS